MCKGGEARQIDDSSEPHFEQDEATPQYALIKREEAHNKRRSEVKKQSVRWQSPKVVKKLKGIAI